MTVVSAVYEILSNGDITLVFCEKEFANEINIKGRCGCRLVGRPDNPCMCVVHMCQTQIYTSQIQKMCLGYQAQRRHVTNLCKTLHNMNIQVFNRVTRKH